MRELDLIGAERNLYILGLTAVDMRALQTLTTSYGDGYSAIVCTNPNCTDCAEHAPIDSIDLTEDHAEELLNTNERLAWYPLRAPFDGTVISKHLPLGESVKDNPDAFIIANLSTVWVDFRVHQRDLPAIVPGQKVIVDCGQNQAEGVITYVSPIVADDTRTALARVILQNPSGRLHPGTFVRGTVAIDRMKTAMVIEKSTIQYMDDQPCVFVYDGHAFDKRNVMLGRTDDKHIEITEGLQTGDNVVIKNAFRIKAEMEKSKTALSGHGHVH